MKKIFVINAGSSSIKYQLFNMPDPDPVCIGQVEKIGGKAEIRYTVKGSPAVRINRSCNISDHREAMEQILALLTDDKSGVIESSADIEIVGHRIVHGGEEFLDATVINEAAKAKIRSLFSLAPLHNPVNYTCLEIAEQFFDKAKHVAIFDTAFHQTMPEKAYRYAIPEDFYREEHIRVYGFHGTSHKYICKKAAEFLGELPQKLISIHLGNGCSITAVRDGRSVDTSMGFGPLAGLVMGTRSGDIDPSVIFHLADKSGMNIDEIRDLLNKNAGLLGLAGSNDMRIIREKINAGDKKAALVVMMYVYRVKKYMGAYAAAMNGVDAILFTAGVGENDIEIRRLICEDMEFLGVRLDEKSNAAVSSEIRTIQQPHSKVKIIVVPTNEELEIALQCYDLEDD
ncbi:acetate/propionate family kinase [Flavitalea sp.]|nr:acetate kinase [Flavitalea sp.]